MSKRTCENCVYGNTPKTMGPCVVCIGLGAGLSYHRYILSEIKCAFCGPDGTVRYAGGESISKHCDGSGFIEATVNIQQKVRADY
jgi:DnaJ-class molecular chaperone